MAVSRRGLIKIAGIGLGATVLVGLGLGQLGGDAPKAPEPATPDYAFGTVGSGTKRVLVGYATRTGSTVGVAAAVGETLAQRGFAVDVKPLKNSPSLEGYDGVVLGSAVNLGKWLPEAVEFVQANQAALARVPVALFCVQILNLGDDDSSKRNRLAYLNVVRPLAKPVAEAYFAGLGKDPADNSFGGWLYRTLQLGRVGDCRDWEVIRGWGRTVQL